MRVCVNMHTMADPDGELLTALDKGLPERAIGMTAAAFLGGTSPARRVLDAVGRARRRGDAQQRRDHGGLVPRARAGDHAARQDDDGADALAAAVGCRSPRHHAGHDGPGAHRPQPRRRLGHARQRRRRRARAALPRGRARRPRVPLRVLGRLARDRRGNGARPAQGPAAAPGRRVRRARRRGRSHRCAHRCRRRRGRRAHRGVRRAAVGGRRRLRGVPGARPVAARARRGAGLPGRPDRAAPRRRAPLRRGRGVRHRGRQRLLRPRRGGVRGRPGPCRERTRFTLRSGAYIVHDDGFYRQISPFDEAAAGPDVPRFRVAMRGLARVVSHPEPGLALLDGGKRDFPYDEGLRSRGCPRPISGALAGAARRGGVCPERPARLPAVGR